jgi:hypothetical protein
VKLWAAALVLVSGCDQLFDIHAIDVQSGAPPDAKIVYLDAPDAANCGMHDEDSDGAFDKCDKCPSISDADDGDSDGDGVGDLCDPDPGPANTIDAFYSFQNGVGLDGTGDSYPNDDLKLGDGANVVTTHQFTTPEVIDVTIATLNAGAAAEIMVNPGGSAYVACEVSTTCVGPMTCLYLSETSGMIVEHDLPFAASAITSLALSRTATGAVRCSVDDLDPAHAVELAGTTMPSGKVKLLSLGGATTFANAIVYNGP